MDGVKDIMRKERYTAGLQEILVDGEFVFAFTFKKNDEEEFLTDVFNIKTGEYISSAYFSGVPNLIKDGYAYYMNPGSQDEFPKIEKFKIEPAVYDIK